MGRAKRLFRATFLAGTVLLPCVSSAAAPQVVKAEVRIKGQPAEASSRSAFGFLLLYRGDGSQVALTGKSPGFTAEAAKGDDIDLALTGVGPGVVAADVTAAGPSPTLVNLGVGLLCDWQTVRPGETLHLEGVVREGEVVHLGSGSHDGAGGVVWKDLRVKRRGQATALVLDAKPGDPNRFPPPSLPALRPAIKQALIEWDWRMQDGLGTERAPSTYAAAIERTLDRGDKLLADLRTPGEAASQWKALRGRLPQLVASGTAEGPDGARLWLDVHRLRRRIALANPLAATGPLVFVKHVPSLFSHQLTEYPGNCARPGGGLFVLEEPGRSMRTRRLDTGLPTGSYEFADVSHDGRKVLFAFCAVADVAPNRERHLDRFFHLYEAMADGSSVRQLTSAAADDFAPRYLPGGKIMFISTRRGGFHRCGQGPCATHTLAECNADGSDPHPVSYHETHEWDPSVLNDGRVIYTRWDYVDRNAVHYQQLWSVRPDGSDVRIYYGNNTLSPVGVWEARPVPGSSKVMATTGAHHAMTAGSTILLDVTQGIDGPSAITRLTPDALFPESEAPVSNGLGGAWSAPYGVPAPPQVLPDAVRWPGHCYKSPQPLSESYFLVAYSFDALIGEPNANPVNMFGLYLVDAFGNKELLYRDLNVCSLWPIPLAPRPRPPVVSGVAEAGAAREGSFFLQDVYQSWPQIPRGSVRSLRVVQVIPKSTWHANQPMLGLPSASPGKQVLGTVPVEPDGSAYFRAPAGLPLSFQALDEKGQAVQVMRSLTYLQPGETASCVGCHEPRTAAPAQHSAALALGRNPSTIRPAPDGANPLSFPILVQPVLDRNCVSCHNRQKPEGNVVLTGEPQGHYTASYNALATRVPYSDWAGKAGDFRVVNSEPTTRPGFFGARGSSVMKLILDGHHDVALTPDDLDRLTTWMDANALFYGTFDPADQARQQRGERIAGPKIQ
jgi:hypothetical protein